MQTLRKYLSYAALAALLYADVWLIFHKSNGGEVLLPSNALPPSVQSQTVIKDNKVITTKRIPPAIPGAEEKITQTTTFLPPEGKATITVQKSGETQVSVQNKGITFTPGAYFLAGGDISAGLGARLFYWDKFGLGAGAAVSLAAGHNIAPFAFADMRLTGIGFNNAAVGIFAKPKTVGVVLSVYFK